MSGDESEHSSPPPLAFLVDRLRVHAYASRAAMGAAAAADAAAHLRALLAQDGGRRIVRMVCAAAPSQGELLAGLVAAPGIDWSRITTFNMDEYVALPPSAPQCFASFLRRHLWDAVVPGAVHVLDGCAADLPAECARFSALLAAAPIDVILLGIGENGHLAFNDPPVADFADPLAVKVVELDAACRRQQVNDGCFAALADVPTHALTLTMPTLTPPSARIFAVVPGPTKRAAVTATLLTSPPAASCPASLLRTHANTTLYVDGGAAASFDAAAAAPLLAAAAAGGAAEGCDYAAARTWLRVGMTAAGAVGLLERRPLLAAEGARRVYVGPGLVDVQVNGYGGVDFNEARALPAARLLDVVRALAAHGVTSLCPTLITSEAGALEANLGALADAADAQPALAAAMAGLHVEGPFISPLDGYRGAHPAAHVLPAADWALFARWQARARGRIALVTLAAEVPGAVPFIAAAAAAGVRVALGHTAADGASVAAAAAAGATLSTHLGNALPQALARHENALLAQLACDALGASLIADGEHLPDALLRLALRAKGARRCVLVSDAAPLAGCAPGRHVSAVGGDVELTADGRRLHLAGQPRTLAGSTLTLERGVARVLPLLRAERAWRRAQAAGGAAAALPPAGAAEADDDDAAALRAAWEMASVQPAALVGRDARLRLGAPADIVRFRLGAPDEGDAAVHIRDVWKAGQRVAGVADA